MNKDAEVKSLTRVLSRYEAVIDLTQVHAHSFNCGSSGCSQHGHH